MLPSQSFDWDGAWFGTHSGLLLLGLVWYLSYLLYGAWLILNRK